MDLNNIERNQLDYFLTDVLPTELSDRFTYIYFYKYLISKNKDIQSMIRHQIKAKNDNNSDILFSGSKSWCSMPLKYTIMKQLHSEREISLLQPIAAVELFLFISTYQKEILSILDKNAIFSLRYHKRNNELVYKNTKKSVIKYFSDLQSEADKEVLEQTGMFFDIGPFKSIAQFTSSEEWFLLNSKYKFFIRTDYKSCFDSIYTHTFNWIIGKDVNDTKKFNNGSIYSSIDRILMNINARTSNGIVVGPEFSRMIAEILLQAIDREVYSRLLNQGTIAGINYNVYRYVDDIFIFAQSEKLANIVVDLYAEVARKYLLQLNETKLYRSKVPFVLEEWLNDTNSFTNKISALLFRNKEEVEALIKANKEKYEDKLQSEEFTPYLLKAYNLKNSKSNIMNRLNELICKYEQKTRTITAYFLGMLLNKVSTNKNKTRIFRESVSEKTVCNFLELVFYAYSYFPNFANTQKLLSILSYVRDEYDILAHKEILQKLINRYAFVFEKGNLNDTINLILFCCQAKIEIPFHQEEKIVKSLREKDDPILWASYLLYAKYSKKYYQEIRNEIGQILQEQIAGIVQKESIFTYREFWWVLIFNKADCLTSVEQDKIDELIASIKTSTERSAGAILGRLFKEYLMNSSIQFFEWDMKKRDFLRNFTFMTKERSIFKNYQQNLNSLEWGSF